LIIKLDYFNNDCKKILLAHKQQDFILVQATSLVNEISGV
jgi:hypothetical protein